MICVPPRTKTDFFSMKKRVEMEFGAILAAGFLLSSIKLMDIEGKYVDVFFELKKELS